MTSRPPTGSAARSAARPRSRGPERRLFAYVVTHDTGFAPNPFHGVLTLACCKPVIRRTARDGDLVVGLSPKVGGHRLVCAMVVAERLTMAEYWSDPRFRAKRPLRRGSREQFVGDNCYEPLADGSWRQHPCRHSLPGGRENATTKATDLRGRNVLVGDPFWYFGAEALALPPGLALPRAGRGHRVSSEERVQRVVLNWLRQHPTGLRGYPSMWPRSALLRGSGRAGASSDRPCSKAPSRRPREIDEGPSERLG